MGKKILLLNGSPKTESFTKALTQSYQSGASNHHEVRRFDVGKMVFNPDLTEGYDEIQTLEPDLISFQESIKWADHIVIATPIWWGGSPAKLKGLIDRTFLPSFAFKYVEGKLWPKQLLTGKTGRLILTMDTPPWYFRFFQGATGARQLKDNVLKFSGISPVKTTMLGPIISSDAAQRQAWANQVEAIGKLGS